MHNAPVLKDAVESQTHRFLRQRALQTEGVLVHAISGIEDHVHMAVTIPPTLNIAEWIGKLKGSSSHFINHEICNRKTLDWQNGYGVVSFGTKDFPWVVEYIRNQKQHHRRGTTQGRLERIEYDEHAAEGGEAR